MKKLIIILPLLLSIVSCATHQNPNFQKNDAKVTSYDSFTVKKHLVKGVTTQADVLKTFGGPTNSTMSANNTEVWAYSSSKLSIQNESSGGGALLGLIPGPLGVIGGAFSESESTDFSGTSKSLIISFKDDIVTDYELTQNM
ncbi:hypothetical protein ABMA67_11055 [Halobacteriovorax sp. RZ-3]|uniref:hypothetical protein n=1 Tax=Halobacteriovorax sp. RZ-3 TaxID=3157720 RepID=UPI003723E746